MLFRRIGKIIQQTPESRSSQTAPTEHPAAIAPVETPEGATSADVPATVAGGAPPDEGRMGIGTPAALSDQQIIEAVYRAFVGRDPDEMGLRHHIALLQSGGLEAVIRDAIASSEFQGLMREQLMREGQAPSGPSDVPTDSPAQPDEAASKNPGDL
jgi:hypothetical protein